MWKIFFVIVALAMLTACGRGRVAEEERIAVEPPAPAVRVPFCAELAAEYIVEIEALWAQDNGDLWGVNLHVPFIIADNVTRQAVANMPDVDGNYITYLPDIAFFGAGNNFGGRTWFVATWDYYAFNTENRAERLRRSAHAGFHGLQRSIFSGIGLRTDEARSQAHRLSTFLEMYALLAALESDGETQLSAIRDALSIRAARHYTLDTFAVHNTLSQEILEGTAQYTEYVLVLEMDEILADIRQNLNSSIGKSYAWGAHGYYTGAMYALLLDKFEVDWKTNLSFSSDLGALLKNALNITSLPHINDIDLTLYSYENIVAAEAIWFERYDRIVQNSTAIFASAHPVLSIPFTVELPFAELDQVFLGTRLVLYGSFTATGLFGELTITEGYLLFQDNWICAAALQIDGNRITGSYWELILNDGFEVMQEMNIFGQYLERFTVRRVED